MERVKGWKDVRGEVQMTIEAGKEESGEGVGGEDVTLQQGLVERQDRGWSL